MKKLLLASLLCIVMTFSACAGNNSANETEVTEWRPTATGEVKKPQAGVIEVKEQQIKINGENTTESTVKPTEETEATTETTQPIPTQGVPNPKGHIPVTTAMGSFDKGDADFIHGKNTLKLNDNIENIFSVIGEDNVSQELSASKMEYIYPDFALYTYIDEEDNEKLERIVITKEGIPTAKGVKKGSYASDLVEIYGNPSEQENGIKYYGKDNNRLIFKYKDNLITEIIYQYTVE